MLGSDYIKNLFVDKEYDKIYQTYSPEVVAGSLGLKNGLELAYRLIYHIKSSKEQQRYAARLLEALRACFLEDWIKDWHFDAFLGSSYDGIDDESDNCNKSYQAYCRAYERADPPPPALMIKLAKFVNRQGYSPVSYEDGEALAKKAFELEPNLDSARILCDIYSAKNMNKEFQYWTLIQNAMCSKGKKFSLLEPFFVSKGYKQAEKQTSEEIKNLFLKKENDRIYQNYSQKTVAESLGFKNSLKLAYQLLYNPEWKEDPQRYAAYLIEAAKACFPDEWSKDWRYEAFLGSAYEVLSGWDDDFDKCYEAYDRAYQQTKPAPAELLIAMARCALGPEGSLISYKQAIELLKTSLAIEPYSEAADLLSLIYSYTKNEEDFLYWKKVTKQLEKEGKKISPLEPAFVREE